MGPGCTDPAWFPGPRVAAFRNSRLQYRVSIVEVTPVRTHLVAIPIVLVTAACLVPSAQASERDAAPVGRMTVEGVIASVDPEASMFRLRVFRSDRARRFGLDDLPVWVQRGTRVDGEDGDWFARSAIWGIHRGDRVTVKGFRLDDGRLLALAIDVRERAASPVFSSDIICRGVVVARGPNLIVVLDTGGTRIIIISATTRFHGLRVSWAALQANDRVVIVGQANGDGTVAAREVQVIGVSR